MWLPVMHQHIYYVYDHKCCYHQTGQCHNLKQENEFMHAKTFFLNTISIWFFWSIFRWLRNSRLPNSIVIWLSNHLKSPLIIKFIPVLLQPNKKNGSASEFVRNFKTIQTHFSKNSMCRAWSRGSILIWSLFWMIWVWPEIKLCGFVGLVSTPSENVVCHNMKRNLLYNFPKEYWFIFWV